jgi:hypothetical protein
MPIFLKKITPTVAKIFFFSLKINSNIVVRI